MVIHHRTEVEAFPYIPSHFPLAIIFQNSAERTSKSIILSKLWFMYFEIISSRPFLNGEKKSRNEEEILLIEPMLCFALLSFLKANNRWLTGQLNTV